MEAKRRKMKFMKNSWTHNDANMAKTDRDKVKQMSNNISEAAHDIDVNKKAVSKVSGPLTNQLLQQGIITQKMIKQLKRELQDQDRSDK